MTLEAQSDKTYSYQAAKPFRQSSLYHTGREIALVALLLIAALALRLYNLTQQSLWYDEANGLYFAHERSFWQAITFFFRFEPHPPLFFGIMNLWMDFFGPTEFAVRFFAVLMGLAALIVLYLIARRWLNQPIALIGLVLLAVSPLHLYWSQTIRPYSLLTLESLVSLYLALLLADKPQRNFLWLIYSLSLTVTIYTHYLGFHIILAQGLALLITLRQNKSALLKMVMAYALVGLSFLPWLGNFLTHVRTTTQSTYLGSQSAERLLSVLDTFASFYLPPALLPLAGAVILPLYFLGANWLWQNYRRVAYFLILVGLLPVLTSWLSGLFQPNFNPRYLVFCLPPSLLVIAVGICSLKHWHKFLPLLALLLLLALNLLGFYNYQQKYIFQDWRSLVNTVVAQQQPGDIVFLANNDGYPVSAFDYYYRYLLNEPGQLPRRSIARKTFSTAEVAQVFQDAKRVWVVVLNFDDGDWVRKQVLPAIPNQFKQTYFKEYNTNDQSSVHLIRYDKTD